MTIPTSRIQDALPQGDEGTAGEEQFLKGMQEQYLAQERPRTQALQDLFSDRIRYGNRVYRLIVAWLVGIGACILAQGISVPGFTWFSFSLSDSVLIALIGGTTASVVGLFMVVVRSIFNISETQDSPFAQIWRQIRDYVKLQV